ncbi:MAG TPA: YHS domain-containing (seleno)protein [Burkholderiaceae bacterium]|nr:YHS domain-containing (seleno)protein [Burkholderiaceae bacterium]
MKNHPILRRLFVICLLSLGMNTFAAPSVNTLKNSFFASQTDTAINGYDSVAYFTQNAPVKGQDAHTHEWKGAKWKFATAANLDLFRNNPDKYAPQYGGYCAYGVAKDGLVKVDPDQFTIFEGKLYLNYDASVQKEWAKDRAGYIRQADAKFPQLLAK